MRLWRGIEGCRNITQVALASTSKLKSTVVAALTVASVLPALVSAADFEETALLSYESQCDPPGSLDCDPIGGGESGTFTHLTGDWFMQRSIGEGPQVFYDQDSPNESWRLSFAADGNVELTPGFYDEANNSTSDPAHPYLNISANGFSCSTTAGWFDVHEMVYDWWGDPILISVSFEQSCNGEPPLTGSLDFSFGGVGPTSFTPGNVLVSNEDVLFEYTPTGTLVQTIYVLESDGTEPPTDAGDLALDAFGTLHLYNGNANPDPVLSSFSPDTGNWQHHAFLDWDGANHGLATTGSYVFASDRKFTVGEPADANGIVRFDLANSYAAERFAQGSDYRDVTIGLDGRVYGSNQNGLSTTVGIYDPDTLALLGALTLDEPVRGLAVNPLGQIFGAGDEIYRFNPDGSVAASIDPAVGLLFDIDLDRSGRIVASALDQDIVLTTEALASVTSFSIANFNDLNVAWVQEPPAILLHSADFESGDTSQWDGASGDYAGLLEVSGAAAATGTFGLSVAVGTSCTDPLDEVVLGPTTTGLSKGCNSVSASDVEVVAPGATFAAGQSVILVSDFSVAAGADFTAAIDSGFVTRLGYVEDILPQPGACYSAEFELNLDSLTLDPADSIDHLVGFSQAGAEVFRATLIRNDVLAENRLVLAAELDVGPPAETPPGEQILMDPGWRTLRFAWRAAAGSGFLVVSVDGLPFVGLTDLDNDTKSIAKIRWGSPSGSIGPSTTGSLQMDDFSSWK